MGIEMRFDEKRTLLRDSRECILRSPEAGDAKSVLKYLFQVSGETHFMVRYPEECMMTIEQEETFLEGIIAADSPEVYIAAWVDGEFAGAVSVNRQGDRIKMRHRAGLGIAVLQKYWGLGLGTILMLSALEAAKEAGYYQVELGVFADNAKAIALYEKMGFEKWGVTRNAFRLKDGTMIDEIMMGKILFTHS